jgi:DNA-directed RNA polymerase subunit L
LLAEITDIKDNKIELKLQEEDISVMYIVQHELLKQRDVEFAGVMLKHPLIKDYILLVLTKKTDPIEAVRDASVSASEYVEEIASTLKSNLKKE